MYRQIKPNAIRKIPKGLTKRMHSIGVEENENKSENNRKQCNWYQIKNKSMKKKV